MEEVQMLRFIRRNIITGLVSILPIAITLYLLYWLAVSAESALGGMIRWVIHDDMYWPGMGLIAGLVVVFILGLLMNIYVVQGLFAKGEELLYRMPLIKSVYRAFRDFFEYFSPAKKREFEQVVSVALGNTGMQVIGFVTQAVSEKLPKDFQENDNILVYIPMSYMIGGGFAVLLPRTAVRPVSMSMEEAMRFTLTAGITGSNASSHQKNQELTK